MATYYLDFDGGNDSNDGTTFANRWKSITSGATAARIAPGDEIRIMASPDPTLVDASAGWVQYDRSVTLSSAVTLNITTCDSVWTASANVTATASTTRKEGTNSASLAIASAFTTGKVAYFATGTLDLSGYQQVSFWVRNSTALSAGRLSLRLCSDTTGDTTVHTIAIPAIPSSVQFVPITVDLGAPMNSAIASVALYADIDPGTITVLLDNILACKASSSADSLTLTSHIGKAHNLSWTASTAYASGSKRRPTQVNRNGYLYNATTGGTSGSSEPVWPQSIGATVSDGSVTWTCHALEDTWYPIKSINGTTVTIDNENDSPAGAGRGYHFDTESVATYKRETIKFTMVSSASTPNQSVQDSGTAAAPITFSGGWDRTDMSAQTGETWVSGQNCLGRCIYTNGKNNITIENYNGTRANVGHYLDGVGITMNNCHAVGNNTVGIFNNAHITLAGQGVGSFNNGTNGFGLSTSAYGRLRAVTMAGNAVDGWSTGSAADFGIAVDDLWAVNNGGYGIRQDSFSPMKVRNLVTANNVTAGVSSPNSDMTLVNASIGEATEFAAMGGVSMRAIYSHNHDKVAGSHYVWMRAATIQSDSSVRNSASGISWKFTITASGVRTNQYPVSMSLAKIKCAANVAKNISIRTRRDATTVNGLLLVEGGQIAGVPEDVAVVSTPSVNTWTDSGTLSFTPTEDGVVELKFLVWDDTGSSVNYWIDDLTVD